MSGDDRTLDEPRLRALLARLDPAAVLVGRRPLEGGISATMAALDIVRGDGRPETVVVRLPGPANLEANPASGPDEYRLLRLLEARGIAAPRALLLDTSREIVPFDALLLGWLEGEVEFAPADPIAAAAAMGELLATVHAIPAGTDLAFLPVADDPLAHQPGLPGDHPARLRPDARERVAAAWAATPKPAQVLIHGDFWPGNMLWRDGALVAALDWEDAGRGDPLCDLGIARVDIAIFFGPAAAEAFAARYGARCGRDLAALPYWDLHACQRAPVDYAEWGQDWAARGRPDIDAAAMEAGRTAILLRAREALGLGRA